MSAPMVDRRLSPHFTLRELTRSDTASRLGISNMPDVAGVALLAQLCASILEPVRAVFGAVSVRSGYRSPALNAKIPGSAKTSEHTLCRAVDFEVQGVSNFDVATWIAHGGLPHGFRQLILEAYTEGDPNSGWVHCSLPRSGHAAEIMTMFRRPDKQGGGLATLYLPGLAR